MEEFRKEVKRRTTFFMSFIGLILVLICLLNYFVPHEESFQIGFTLGTAVATEMLAAMYLIKCRKALKSDELLKKMYIEEHDERYLYIKSKMGGLGLSIVIYTLVVATIIAGFFDKTVFLSLLSTVLFSSLVKGALKIYYKNKV